MLRLDATLAVPSFNQRFLKDSQLPLPESIKVIADTGYTGIHKIHNNSEIPKRSSKFKKLSKEDKKENMAISKRRIYIEHINRDIKCFKIFSYEYRNNLKTFALKFSLVCGIYNSLLRL